MGRDEQTEEREVLDSIFPDEIKSMTPISSVDVPIWFSFLPMVGQREASPDFLHSCYTYFRSVQTNSEWRRFYLDSSLLMRLQTFRTLNIG
jgi:hypothetical protein